MVTVPRLPPGYFYLGDKLEIYVNDSNRDVVLEVGVTPVSPTVKILGVVDNYDAWKDDETLPRWLDYTINTVVVDGNTVKVTIPFTYCQYDRTLKLSWEFSYIDDTVSYDFADVTEVNVVTPILSLSKIKEILGTDATDEDVSNIEKATRTIIQAHTGQEFGHFKEVRKVYGNDSPMVELPGRLISFKTINGMSFSARLRVSDDGTYMVLPDYKNRPTYTNYSEGTTTFYTNGIVYAPRYTNWPTFIRTDTMLIDGEWGYLTVPQAVQEAAKLLINDYSCLESAYRDRYLDSMSSADWKIAFNEGAWTMTGNARADDLLLPYVFRGGWAVL